MSALHRYSSSSLVRCLPLAAIVVKGDYETSVTDGKALLKAFTHTLKAAWPRSDPTEPWRKKGTDDPCENPVWKWVKCRDTGAHPRVSKLNLAKHDDSYKLTATVNFSSLPRALHTVDLGGNRFNGPADLTNLPAYLLNLHLPHNHFEGPVDLTKLPGTLEMLDLSSNKFNGILDLTLLPEPMLELEATKNKFRRIHFPDTLQDLPSTLRVLKLKPAHGWGDTLVYNFTVCFAPTLNVHDLSSLQGLQSADDIPQVEDQNKCKTSAGGEGGSEDGASGDLVLGAEGGGLPTTTIVGIVIIALVVLGVAAGLFLQKKKNAAKAYAVGATTSGESVGGAEGAGSPPGMERALLETTQDVLVLPNADNAPAVVPVPDLANAEAAPVSVEATPEAAPEGAPEAAESDM